MLFTSFFTPTPLPTTIIAYNPVRVIKQSYLKSACTIEVVFLRRLIFYSSFWPPGGKFPEGLIKHYEETSFTIAKSAVAQFQLPSKNKALNCDYSHLFHVLFCNVLFSGRHIQPKANVLLGKPPSVPSKCGWHSAHCYDSKRRIY